MIYVTHSLAEVKVLCDEVLRVEQGRVRPDTDSETRSGSA